MGCKGSSEKNNSNASFSDMSPKERREKSSHAHKELHKHIQDPQVLAHSSSKIFDAYDMDGSGYIDKEEYKEFSRSFALEVQDYVIGLMPEGQKRRKAERLRREPTEVELSKAWNEALQHCDREGNKKFDREEFHQLCIVMAGVVQMFHQLEGSPITSP